MNQSQRHPTWRRGVSFLKRLRWISSLAGGLVAGAALLVRIRHDRDALHRIRYRGIPVLFCGHDEQALREVLVDREYAFLAERLAALNAPTILDVGAHIGTFAVWALDVNPEARILSLEADPATVRTTERNCEAVVQQGQHWEVMHGAASDSEGATIRFSDDGPSMSHRAGDQGTLEVTGVTLASLIARVTPDGGSVDLLKVDIEGSEEAFLCADPELLDRVEALVVELHPGLCDTERVRDVLARRFSSVVNVGGRKSTKPLLYCRRDP